MNELGSSLKNYRIESELIRDVICGKKEQLKFVKENRTDIENNVCKNNIIKIKIKH